jgi:hypothetical protein
MTRWMAIPVNAKNVTFPCLVHDTLNATFIMYSSNSKYTCIKFVTFFISCGLFLNKCAILNLLAHTYYSSPKCQTAKENWNSAISPHIQPKRFCEWKWQSGWVWSTNVSRNHYLKIKHSYNPSSSGSYPPVLWFSKLQSITLCPILIQFMCLITLIWCVRDSLPYSLISYSIFSRKFLH